MGDRRGGGQRSHAGGLTASVNRFRVMGARFLGARKGVTNKGVDPAVRASTGVSA